MTSSLKNERLEPRGDPCPTNDESGVAELLARVEAATGADRELDFAIYRIAFNAKQVGGDSGVREAWLPGYVYPHEAKPYTASLDAALALVERVLPGYFLQMERCRPGGESIAGKPWWARLNSHHDSATGSTPALALLAAMLRAIKER